VDEITPIVDHCDSPAAQKRALIERMLAQWGAVSCDWRATTAREESPGSGRIGASFGLPTGNVTKERAPTEADAPSLEVWWCQVSIWLSVYEHTPKSLSTSDMYLATHFWGRIHRRLASALTLSMPGLPLPGMVQVASLA
jgi:hypothetical protein